MQKECFSIYSLPRLYISSRCSVQRQKDTNTDSETENSVEEGGCDSIKSQLDLAGRHDTDWEIMLVARANR